MTWPAKARRRKTHDWTQLCYLHTVLYKTRTFPCSRAQSLMHLLGLAFAQHCSVLHQGQPWSDSQGQDRWYLWCRRCHCCTQCNHPIARMDHWRSGGWGRVNDEVKHLLTMSRLSCKRYKNICASELVISSTVVSRGFKQRFSSRFYWKILCINNIFRCKNLRANCHFHSLWKIMSPTK